MTSSQVRTPQARILVVTEDPQTARLAVRVLGMQGGFDVTHTADLSIGLRLIRSRSADLVVIEAQGPGMASAEFLDELCREDPLLPVAVLSAPGPADGGVGAVRGLHGRAVDVLQWPLRPDELIAAAAALIEQGRAARLAAREVVLAIGAHCDDVEIGAGGTLLAHRNLGHQVTILTLSCGASASASGGRENRPAMLSAAAARILGADIRLADLGTAAISAGQPTVGVIGQVVDQLRPTVLYTHSVNDTQQDHRNTHRAAMSAASGVGRIYCFQSPSASADFGPSLFVDIEAVLPAKLAATGEFGSLTSGRAHQDPGLITSTARHWGRFAESRYAEAFEVIRDHSPAAAQAGARPDAVPLIGRIAAPAASRTRGEVSHAAA